jgi:MOSC domain-containing protein YiiM
MKLLSVNVGLPREVPAGRTRALTSIFKAPVDGRVAVVGNNLAGDQQSDLSVHGGPSKAVYAYPSEHYDFWRDQLSDVDLTPGIFGENLTTEGLSEETMHVGDVLTIGSVELMVTQPRLPCFKLGIRFNRADMVKRFLASRRSGFYFAVVTEGDLGAGDTIRILTSDADAISIRELVGMYVGEPTTVDRLRSAAENRALPAWWRDTLRERAASGDVKSRNVRPRRSVAGAD